MRTNPEVETFHVYQFEQVLSAKKSLVVSFEEFGKGKNQEIHSDIDFAPKVCSTQNSQYQIISSDKIEQPGLPIDRYCGDDLVSILFFLTFLFSCSSSKGRSEVSSATDLHRWSCSDFTL